eukprot:scaffold770_cov255-Pinguiococcus_pyrenoidosus.AAC.40
MARRLPWPNPVVPAAAPYVGGVWKVHVTLPVDYPCKSTACPGLQGHFLLKLTIAASTCSQVAVHRLLQQDVPSKR